MSESWTISPPRWLNPREHELLDGREGGILYLTNFWFPNPQSFFGLLLSDKLKIQCNTRVKYNLYINSFYLEIKNFIYNNFHEIIANDFERIERFIYKIIKLYLHNFFY